MNEKALAYSLIGLGVVALGTHLLRYFEGEEYRKRAQPEEETVQEQEPPSPPNRTLVTESSAKLEKAEPELPRQPAKDTYRDALKEHASSFLTAYPSILKLHETLEGIGGQAYLAAESPVYSREGIVFIKSSSLVFRYTIERSPKPADGTEPVHQYANYCVWLDPAITLSDDPRFRGPTLRFEFQTEDGTINGLVGQVIYEITDPFTEPGPARIGWRYHTHAAGTTFTPIIVYGEKGTDGVKGSDTADQTEMGYINLTAFEPWLRVLDPASDQPPSR